MSMESTPSPRPVPAEPPRGWWSRNWKWVVPTGCLTLLVLFAIFITAIVFIVFGAMRSTDAYKIAVARAKAHPEVVEALGSPIEEGMLLSGSTNVEGASGQANLSIPISGPKGKGTLYAVATKTAGQWKYSTLQVQVQQTVERIDIGADVQ